MRRIPQSVRRFLHLDGFILGASILSVVTAHVSVSRWYETFGASPGDFYPDFWLQVPYLLLFTSIAVMIAKWWSYLFAMLVGAWLIYTLGYMSLLSEVHAHGRPLVSIEAFQSWFSLKSAWQPQELYQLSLGIVIFVYSAVGLIVVLRRRFPSHMRVNL